MKLPRVKNIFKTSRKFSSDEELRAATEIKIYSNRSRLLPADGKYRGILMAQVKRRNGYARVYLKGVVDFYVILSECGCCDETYGTFRPDRKG